MKILLLGIDGKLGDAAINSTFAKYAIEIDKKANLHVIASGAAFEYWKLLGVANKIYFFDHPRIINLLKISKEIRKEKYDYIVAFRSKFKNEKTKFLLWAARPRFPIIYSDDDSSQNSQHVIQKSFAALEKIYGLDMSNNGRSYFHPPIAFTPSPQAPYCILNFFGADNNTNRSFNQMEAGSLIDALSKKIPNFYFKILCTRDSFNQIQKWNLNFHEKFSIEDTTNNIERMLSLCNSASAIITVDTSLVHIASALNKPVIAIYKNCNWQINAWGPRSDVFELIKSNNPMSIRGFSIDEIVAKVQKVLAISNYHSS